MIQHHLTACHDGCCVQTIWKKRDKWFLWYLIIHFTMNGVQPPRTVGCRPALGSCATDVPTRSIFAFPARNH